jgi:WhiB family redox-sensing transcriptional regulator
VLTATTLIDEGFELLGGAGFADLFGAALSDPALGLDPLAKECPEDVPCRVANQDLWFADTPAELELAKQLCLDCPARRACLAGAVDRREPWGVWGGELFERGTIVARKRPRGRPRKDAAASPGIAATAAGAGFSAAAADATFVAAVDAPRPSVEAEGNRPVVAA